MRIISLTSDSGNVEGLFPVDDAQEQKVVQTFTDLNGSLPQDQQVYVKSWDPTDSTPKDALDWFAERGAEVTDEHRQAIQA